MFFYINYQNFGLECRQNSSIWIVGWLFVFVFVGVDGQDSQDGWVGEDGQESQERQDGQDGQSGQDCQGGQGQDIPDMMRKPMCSWIWGDSFCGYRGEGGAAAGPQLY